MMTKGIGELYGKKYVRIFEEIILHEKGKNKI